MDLTIDGVKAPCHSVLFECVNLQERSALSGYRDFHEYCIHGVETPEITRNPPFKMSHVPRFCHDMGYYDHGIYLDISIS